jgi:hypothetical protein
MHTAIVIFVGLVVLGICAAIGRYFGGAPGMATAALVFLPIWFLGAAVNLIVGVRKAGYTVTEEAPIFLLVFAIPAAVAVLVWWKLRS